MATNFRSLQAPSSLSAQYLTSYPVLGLVPAAESILHPSPVLSIILWAFCLALGLCLLFPTNQAWALPPNKGALSNAVLCVPCLGLCVD